MSSVSKSALLVGIGLILMIAGYLILHSLSTTKPARSQAARANTGFAILCLGAGVGAVGTVRTVRIALVRTG